MNRAGVERYRERSAGLEHGEVRGTADSDGAAFDKIDARLTGFDVNIAATTQNGFCSTLHNLHAHGAFDGDGLAVNGADRVSERRIVMGSGAEKKRSGAHQSGGAKNREDSPKWPRLRAKRHTVWLLKAHGNCNPSII
jgi:hypothetical protein